MYWYTKCFIKYLKIYRTSVKFKCNSLQNVDFKLYDFVTFQKHESICLDSNKSNWHQVVLKQISHSSSSL